MLIERATMKDLNAMTAGIPRGAEGFLLAKGYYTAKADAPKRGSKTGKMHRVWDREVDNLITAPAILDILTKYLKNGTTSAAWYAGLVDNSGFSEYAAGDTLASHAGWTEFTNYTGNRKAVTFGTAGSGALASSSIATFSIGGSGTLDGLFICDAATGTSGILLSEGAFTAGDAPVASGYVVTLTYQLSLASA